MFRLVALALALVGTSAFAPASFGARVARGSKLNAGVIDTLNSLPGPDIPWGSDGVLQGFDEAEIKGQDSFKVFAAALASSGLDVSGAVTVLAPTDTACAGKTLDVETLKYHILPAATKRGSISGDQMTTSGKALTYRYVARQIFLDDAVIGIKPMGAATGMTYPVDVDADGGAVIHGLDQVLDPKFTKAVYGGIGGIQ